MAEPDDGERHQPTAADVERQRHWRGKTRRQWATVDRASRQLEAVDREIAATATVRPRTVRPRGAGRPRARRSSSSSTTSGSDPGDDDEPPPRGPAPSPPAAREAGA